MKKLVSILALALMLGACQNTTQNTTNSDDATADAEKKTTLVTYFSASEVRATERVAKTLAEATDADLFEIVPALAYTTEDLDWKDEQSRSTIEMKDSTARPEVVNKVENMDQYDNIILGYPAQGAQRQSSRRQPQGVDRDFEIKSLLTVSGLCKKV